MFEEGELNLNAVTQDRFLLFFKVSLNMKNRTDHYRLEEDIFIF